MFMVFAASHLQQRHYLTLHSLLPPPLDPPRFLILISSSSNVHRHLQRPRQQLLVGQPSSWHGSWPFRTLKNCIYILNWQFRIH